MHTVDLGIIIGYLLLTLAVGLYQGRKVKSMKDFAVANKEITTSVLVATIFATWIGGNSTIGVAERVYSVGFVFFFVLLSDSVHKFLLARLIAPRMSHFSQAISMGDLMHSKYGQLGRMVTGILSSLKSIGTIGLQISAMSFLLKYFVDIPTEIGVLVSCAIVVFYSAYGGIRAVCMTDVIQFGILIIAIPVICEVGLTKIGGYKMLLEKVPSTHLDIFQEHNLIKYCFLFILFCIPDFDPAVMQRLLIAKNIKSIQKSFQISALLNPPFYLIVTFIAFIALVLNPALDPNMAFLYVINEMLPWGFKGLAIAGMMAVIMSSADSALHAASVSFVHDFMKPLFGQTFTEKKELLMARLVTLMVGLGSIVIAMNFKSLFDIYLVSLSFWVPVVTVPLFAVFFDAPADHRNFIAGIVTGVTSWLLTKYFLEPTWGIDPLIPSLAGNALGFFGVTLLFPSQRKSSPSPSSGPSPRAFPTPSLETRFSWRSCLKGVPHTVLGALQKCIDKCGAPYTTFSIFATVCYLIPYFMWSYDGVHNEMLLGLRLTACGLCFLLMIRDYWPVFLKNLLPFYWYFLLTYCLIFLPTFMMFYTGGQTIWLFNIAVGLFFLGVLVDWISFMAILGIGTLISYGVVTLFITKVVIQADFQSAYLAIYLCVFAALISLLFSRRREFVEESRQKTLKAAAGAIAHEMRTPLASVMINGSLVSDVVCELEKLEGAFTGQQKELFDAEIKDLKNAAQSLSRVSRESQNVVTLLLTNLQQDFTHLPCEKLSMKEVLDHALETFVFKGNGRSKVHVTVEQDFTVEGNRDLLTHVFFNLLKNSLYFIQAAGKGEIFITLKGDADHHTVIFKDTGLGIKKEALPKLFNAFYSQRTHGTGIGLAFCQRVMESMKGRIRVDSTFGEYTTFTLTFPKETG